MPDLFCEIEWVRGVIDGTIKFRKCPNCVDGLEIQAYDENGNPCTSDTPGATRCPCEKCDSLGYIEIPHEERQ